MAIYLKGIGDAATQANKILPSIGTRTKRKKRWKLKKQSVQSKKAVFNG